jgi:hypothetical protein
MPSILEQDDELRKILLGDTSSAPPDLVDAGGMDVADPAPPDLVDPGPEAVVREPLPVPDDFGAAPKIAEQPQPQERKPRLSDAAFDSVSQAIYAAGTRSKLPDSFFSREHDYGVKERQLDLMGQKANKAPVDPNDPKNVAAREAFRRLYPDYATAVGPALDAMDAKGIEDLFKVAGAKSSLAQRGELADRNHDLARQKFDASMGQFDRRMGAMQRSQEAIQKRYQGTALQKFGDEVEKDVPIVAALKEIEADTTYQMPNGEMVSLVKGFVPDGAAKDVPTLDSWSRIKLSLPMGLGTRITDSDKVNLQTKVKMLNELFGRGLAGATFTPEEMARFAKILNDAAFSSPEAMAASLDLVRKVTANKIRQKEAAYGESIPEELWDQYANDGGVTTRLPLFRDIQFSAPVKTRSVESLGQAEIPKEAESVMGKALGAVNRFMSPEQESEARAERDNPVTERLDLDMVKSLVANGKPIVVRRVKDGVEKVVSAEQAQKLLTAKDEFGVRRFELGK